MDLSKFLSHEYSKEDKKILNYNNSVAKMKKSQWDYTDLQTENEGVINNYYQKEIKLDEFDMKNKLEWYFLKVDSINKKWLDDILLSFNNLIYEFRKSKNTGQLNFIFIHKFYHFVEDQIKNDIKESWFVYYYFAGNYIGLMIDFLLFTYDTPKDGKDFADTITTFFFDNTKGVINETDFINFKILLNFLEVRNNKPSECISYIEANFFNKKLIHQLDWFFQNLKKISVQREIKKTWNRLKNQDAKKDLLKFILFLNKKDKKTNLDTVIDYNYLEDRINTSMKEIFSKKLEEFAKLQKKVLKTEFINQMMKYTDLTPELVDITKQVANNLDFILQK